MSKTCKCGADATVGVSMEGRPTFWTCADHAGVPPDAPWAGGEPAVTDYRQTCSWKSFSLFGAGVRACACGTHLLEGAVS